MSVERGGGVVKTDPCTDTPIYPQIAETVPSYMYLYRGHILSLHLSMGDRIHKHCFLEFPKCTGKKESPQRG